MARRREAGKAAVAVCGAWRRSGQAGPPSEPWDIQTARVIGAVIFASVAARLSSSDLRTAFAEGADRLAEAALAD